MGQHLSEICKQLSSKERFERGADIVYCREGASVGRAAAFDVVRSLLRDVLVLTRDSTAERAASSVSV